MADLDTGGRRAHHPRGDSWIRADTASGRPTGAANCPAHQHESTEIRGSHRRFAALLHRGAVEPFPNFGDWRRDISGTKFAGGHRFFQRFRYFPRRLRAFDEYRARNFSRRPALERAGARRLPPTIGNPGGPRRGVVTGWETDRLLQRERDFSGEKRWRRTPPARARGRNCERYPLVARRIDF